jgi:poly-gamma-glutamate synthesis protein (capsule biosynthesis protein)
LLDASRSRDNDFVLGLVAALVCEVLQAMPTAAPEPTARANPPARRRATIAAVGDVMFGRYKIDDEGERTYRAVVRGDAFAAVAPLLRDADLAFANLETPIMYEPATSFRVHPRLTFRADPARAGELARAGFDVISLANNHVHNLGGRGAAESRVHLEQAGIAAAGAGADVEQAFQPVLRREGGLKIAFLAYTLWHNALSPVTPEGVVAHISVGDLLHRVPDAVRAARAELGADFVVVSVHWGTEFEAHPAPSQIEAAHLLVDAGADLVLGHHPHVLQDIERYHGGVIAYSLGNFVFDEGFLSRRQTMILHATLDGTGTLRRVTDVSITPIMIGHIDHVPRPASGPDRDELQKKLRELAPGIPVRVSPDSQLRASR